MSIHRTIAPYGSWKSPITADRIVEGGVSLGQVALDGSDIYWSEMRPAEGGRHVILRWRHGAVEEVLPAPFSARTRAHEYGGGAFMVNDGVLYFSNDRDQLLYRLAPDNPPQAITVGADKRYADGVIDRRHHRILCVCEDHSAGGEPVNTIVSIDPEGRREARVLVAGQDFYASPRLSPDGRRLAWLSWNHPDMPWGGAELWLAGMGPDGPPPHPRRGARGPRETPF